MDRVYMELALELAKKGLAKVNPNPMVGAVVVKDNKIIGKGWHKFYGGPHAEVYALDEAGEEAKGATIYVSLEPCSHFGKTPPCCEKILKSGIKKCVIACLDPNPLVAGKGIERLKSAGIEVEVGLLEKEAKALNRVFFKYITQKKAYLFLKCAITLDGKIATRAYDSKWISNEAARYRVQELRNELSAIMIGINTLKKDNPSLTCRLNEFSKYSNFNRNIETRNPYRVIIDPFLEISNDRKILQFKDKKNIIITSQQNKNRERVKELINKEVKFIFLENYIFSFNDILNELANINIDSVLLEGGSELISSAFKENEIDEGQIFIAPKILGDEGAVSFVKNFKVLNMSDAINLKNTSFEIYDNNISIRFSKL